ncbi:hypothetical protein PY257_13915 [Ramlibacter sp. H39-3-26]|uniref:hypothetical protein n=1 Tax=Curvibacter soli TaxID=3031331 RepID=UPI0023DC9632|nr:hypothetical protein [Ramlibacter sp. H39-3-26]MDF1486259.1 hypothetical protein [Ramlibacter sp. H39-3-26]
MHQTCMAAALAAALSLAASAAGEDDGAPVKTLGVVTVQGGQPTCVQNLGRLVTRGVGAVFGGSDVALRGLDLNASLTCADSVVKDNAGFAPTPGDTLGIDNLRNHQYWNFHPYPQRSYSAELRADF